MGPGDDDRVHPAAVTGCYRQQLESHDETAPEYGELVPWPQSLWLIQTQSLPSRTQPLHCELLFFFCWVAAAVTFEQVTKRCNEMTDADA